MPISYVVTQKIVHRNGISRPVSLVEVTIEGGAATPQEFADSILPAAFEVNSQNGVVLAGRGPIWGYAMLLNFFHPSAWVGVFDPRLGVVVVQSHIPDIADGEVWEME